MRIERKSPDNIFHFRDLSPGSVFKTRERSIYIKFDLKYGNSLLRNAVDLETGCPVLFDEDEEVEFLEKAILTY